MVWNYDTTLYLISDEDSLPISKAMQEIPRKVILKPTHITILKCENELC